VSQPDTGEQALEIVDTLVRSNAIDVLVVDSVAALCRGPKSKAKWATAMWAFRRV
jgi:RecA/RadA recombinase